MLDFCMKVGLPVCLEDIGVTSVSPDELAAVAAKACIAEESIHAMPFEVTEQMVASAILVADKTGRAYKEAWGK